LVFQITMVLWNTS